MLPRPAIGESDFLNIRRQGALWVDKSQYITEVLNRPALVQLYPRPRRFGKTTNLTMLRAFLEIGADCSWAFQDLKVWKDPDARQHFQQYPVIHLSFKGVTALRWTESLRTLMGILRAELDRHEQTWRHDAVAPQLQERLYRIAHGTEDLTGLLPHLCAALRQATGRQVVILIDEYDAPLLNAWTHGHYDEAAAWFRALFTAGLKDNPHLFRGVLTGVLRVARESMFSGLNNIVVYSLLGRDPNEPFGFTEPEVEFLLEQAGRSAELPEVRRWYNGFVFCDTVVYNPWSILNFLGHPLEPCLPYWLNTSDSGLVRKLLREQVELGPEMERLLRGEAIEAAIDENVTLRQLHGDAVWGLLLFSGYLKLAGLRREADGTRTARLAIPNQEVSLIWEQTFRELVRPASRLAPRLPPTILAGEAARVQEILEGLLLRSSHHDLSRPELFYHAFVLGLLVELEATHQVRSNREVGHGRSDIQILPKKAGDPGVVMEFKAGPEAAGEALAEAALQQIADRHYTAELEAAGVRPIHRLGIAFSGKKVVVRGASLPASPTP